MVKVKQIILKHHVNSGYPTKDDFEEKEFEMDIDTTKLDDGQIIASLQYVSPDPYMRGRMTTHKSYIPPFTIGEPIAGFAIAKVVKSSNDKWKVGDFLAGIVPWSSVFIYDGNNPLLNKIDTNLGAPNESYLGLLGMPGLTAYHGLNEIADPKPGETMVISGAAGAVGQYVGQIGKIKGCRVIGIAGSDDKVEYMIKELGFDAGVNYNSPTYKEDIAKLAPKIDIYWENVGGDVSDAIWPHLNQGARIPLCGLISAYNKSEQDIGPRFLHYVLKTSSKIQGFIVSNYAKKNPEALKQLAIWYKSGQLKDKFTLNHGFDQLIPSFLGLFKGLNTGKMIVKIE